QGFIKDDKVLLEARISVEAVESINYFFGIYSTAESPREHAGRGGSLRVAQDFQYLATQSPFFSALFFKDFKEKNQSEIELEDLAFEVTFYLFCCCFTLKELQTAGVRCSQVEPREINLFECALDKVETYLIKTKNVTVQAKLLLTDQYRLVMLKMHCLDSTLEAVKTIEKTVEYKKFSDALKLSLLKRIFSLIK
ncbi:hypothetical protein PENTCL1PPCAC_24795, partial [Pristionchus entomophagus]